MARGIFPRELAEAILPRVWERVQIDPNNPSSWTQQFLILQEVISDEPIPQIFQDRYQEIIDDLCGASRWDASNGLGYWPITFPNFSGDPWSPSGNWHVDHTADERYFNPPKLGLIALHFFSDIAPNGGGTAIRVASHKHVARVLAKAGPEGLPEMEFSRCAVAATRHLTYVEATGQMGDVLFLHPFSVHSASFNNSNRIRVLGHKLFHLSNPVNPAEKNRVEPSLVERATCDVAMLYSGV